MNYSEQIAIAVGGTIALFAVFILGVIAYVYIAERISNR